MPAKSPRAADGYRIGEAAQHSGVSAANIRYYEKEGLLAAQPRADNDYRIYSARDLHQLRFIRLCRAMDMSLDEVRTLLALDLRFSHARLSAVVHELRGSVLRVEAERIEPGSAGDLGSGGTHRTLLLNGGQVGWVVPGGRVTRGRGR